MNQETQLSETNSNFNHLPPAKMGFKFNKPGETEVDHKSATATDSNSVGNSDGGSMDNLDLIVTGKQMVPSELPNSPNSSSKIESEQLKIPKVSLTGAVNCVTKIGDDGDNPVSLTNHCSPERLNKVDKQLPKEEEEMVDITIDFCEAVKSLELGELLHDPCFGLFEAMSAIEMMDPKMDAGMICNKWKRPILNFDQAVQDGSLKLENLSAEELIGISDTTLSCLVTWIEGHSLAQTVFTNLYLHRPTAIGDKFLKATSVAALKLVDVIEECISKAGVFEEEDFQPSVYGYNLATMFSDSKTSSMLRECEDDLQKRAKLITKAQQKPDSNETGPDAKEELDKIDALLGRLKFFRLFHSLLLHIWKRDDLSECHALLSGCQEALGVLQKSVGMGVTRGEDESEPFMVGFELLVNQRLLPPTFPRSTKIKSNEETFKFFDTLLGRIKTVLKVTTIQNFHGILEFFHSFSETRPCVLSRSLLQLLYGPMRFKKPGVNDMMDAMKEAVKGFMSPPVLSSKFKGQNREVSDCVDMFFERTATVFANLLIACGHNRARQRDKLAHLMEDFAHLQIETDKIDNYVTSMCMQMDGIRPHGNCFGTWLLCHISKLMIRYVFTGFELELYSVHEYAYIYWYLNEFLYPWLLSTYSRAEAYLVEGENSLYEKNGKRSGKNKVKGNKSRTKAYAKEILLLQAEQNFTGGYFKTLMGLINDGRIPFPNAEFDNESVRYRHRFAPFTPIQTPALVHYMQYKQISELASSQTSANLYLAATKNFQQAKQVLEAIPGSEKEVQDLLKIAKTNFVVVKLLASGHTKESRTPPEFDFSVHMYFPIIKVG